MRTKLIERRKFLYICSAPYSGSTLLCFLLATHQAATTIGEATQLYRKVLSDKPRGNLECSCGYPISECPFWGELRQRIKSKILTPPSIDFSRHVYPHSWMTSLMSSGTRFPLLYRCKTFLLQLLPPIIEHRSRFKNDNYLAIQEILDMTKRSVFIDSSKSVLSFLNIYPMPNFDFRVILLLRDGRAFLNSVLKYQSVISIDSIARQWCRSASLPQKYFDQLGVPYITIRHEDVCSSPQQTLRLIFEFAGMDKDMFTLNYFSDAKHVLGNNKMRLSRVSQICLDESWKETLNFSQLKQFEREAGRMLQQYGYD